jgi:hypothetical protein
VALNPKDMPITRETVYEWLMDWEAMAEADRPPIVDYISSKVKALNLPDPMVNTQFHEDLGNETSVADMILADLPSYGITYH